MIYAFLEDEIDPLRKLLEWLVAGCLSYRNLSVYIMGTQGEGDLLGPSAVGSAPAAPNGLVDWLWGEDHIGR